MTLWAGGFGLRGKNKASTIYAGEGNVHREGGADVVIKTGSYEERFYFNARTEGGRGPTGRTSTIHWQFVWEKVRREPGNKGKTTNASAHMAPHEGHSLRLQGDEGYQERHCHLKTTRVTNKKNPGDG